MEWEWVVLLVVALLAIGVWLSWTAGRLDRIHQRIENARASLTAHLLRRSGAALELGVSGALDPARSLLLVEAAHAARAAPEDELESAESDLSQTLRAVFPDPDELRALRQDPDVGPVVEELATNCRKVELARRFHNDAVAAGRGLRAARRVRWLGLAGHAPQPRTIDLDDVPPPALLAD